jgi:hypothetical protein
MKVRGQLHVLRFLPWTYEPPANCIGSWVNYTAGLDAKEK